MADHVNDAKAAKLASKGWQTGDASTLLQLSPDEERLIELRLRLADGLRAQRLSKGLTQSELAGSLHSSQSRVAKMEAGDPTVSIDLLVRSLLALGATHRDLAALIVGGP